MVRRPGRLPTTAGRHGRTLPRNASDTPGTCGTPPPADAPGSSSPGRAAWPGTTGPARCGSLCSPGGSCRATGRVGVVELLVLGGTAFLSRSVARVGLDPRPCGVGCVDGTSTSTPVRSGSCRVPVASPAESHLAPAYGTRMEGTGPRRDSASRPRVRANAMSGPTGGGCVDVRVCRPARCRLPDPGGGRPACDR
jgi:hypothetical protein